LIVGFKTVRTIGDMSINYRWNDQKIFCGLRYIGGEASEERTAGTGLHFFSGTVHWMAVFE